MYFSSYSLIITQDKQIIARNTRRSYFETIKLNTWWFNYGSILDFKWRSPFCIIVWTIYDKGVNRAKVSKFQLQFEPSKSVFLCVFFFIFSKLRWFPETIFWSYKLYRFKISAQFRVRWCIWLLDSYWTCQYSLYFVHIHAYKMIIKFSNFSKFSNNLGIRSESSHLDWI